MKRESGWSAVENRDAAQALFTAWNYDLDGARTRMTVSELILARDHAALIGRRNLVHAINKDLCIATCRAVGLAIHG